MSHESLESARFESLMADGNGVVTLRCHASNESKDSFKRDDRAVTTVPIQTLFPGSFNPVHSGHLEIAQIAAAATGNPVWFEIAVVNADKPSLSFSEIQSRLAGDFGDHGVVLTRAALFVEKARLFPGCTFVVGADTLIRINESQYYNDGHRSRSIEQIRNLDCSFLVFPRKCGNIVLAESNLHIEPDLKSICRYVSENKFRMDLSSSEIRNSPDDL